MAFNMNEERVSMPLRRFVFWIAASVIAYSLIVGFIGFEIGQWKESENITSAMVFADRELRKKHPILNLMSDGTSFCYDTGNIYPVEKVPRRYKSLLPLFKAVQTEF